jgi:hypothetical protein
VPLRRIGRISRFEENELKLILSSFPEAEGVFFTFLEAKMAYSVATLHIFPRTFADS